MQTFNENDFKDILDSMVDGVITINQKGLILTFNKTAETMFGYTSEEAVGKNVSMLMPEPIRSEHDSYVHNHTTTGESHIIGIGRNVTALRRNGDTFPMYLSVVEYSAKVEGDRWFIGTCRDMTLQNKQEEQLKRSMKMDAIGKLTSGIAHDYNNALGVIMGFTELLTEKIQDRPDLLDFTNPIMQAAKRAANLTSQLLSLTRKRTDTSEIVQINDILKTNQQILDKTLTSKIKLTINPENELWTTFVDSGCLEDAILNLSINAMHAMPEGGELNISTTNTPVDSITAQVLDIEPGDYVILTIRDTGIGMTKDVVAHIFEPFYSTKGEKGTGLGLSQVYNFVTGAKGTIRVYSEPGHGTIFSIYLPRYQQGLSSTTADENEEFNESDLNGSANILVVDDEQSIRNLSVEILSHNGYSISCASSAKEALSILENEKIDLILSDVIMPEMDGFELAHIVHHTYPDIKIQLCSGFSDIKGKSVTNEHLASNLLLKPFTSKQLLLKVYELLES